MGKPANYIILEDEPGKPLIIQDVGPWPKHATVTNDAERVVRELLATKALIYPRRLWYIDLEGALAEIIFTRKGRVDAFRPLPRLKRSHVPRK